MLFLCVLCVLCVKDFSLSQTLPRPDNSVITRTGREFFTRVQSLNIPLPTLVSLFEHQDKTFSSAFSVLMNAIAARAFPAASIAITRHDRVVALKSFGHLTYEADSPPVTSATLFDLASLTKVVATTTMAMILYERGLLELDAPTAAIIPEFVSTVAERKDPRRRDVTLRMLLAHSS